MIAVREEEDAMDSRLLIGSVTRMSGGMDGDDDGFGGGRVALVGDAVDGDEHVGFGEIGRDAGAGNGVRDHHKV